MHVTIVFIPCSNYKNLLYIKAIPRPQVFYHAPAFEIPGSDTVHSMEINESKLLLLLDHLPIYAGLVQTICILKISLC